MAAPHAYVLVYVVDAAPVDAVNVKVPVGAQVYGNVHVTDVLLHPVTVAATPPIVTVPVVPPKPDPEMVHALPAVVPDMPDIDGVVVEVTVNAELFVEVPATITYTVADPAATDVGTVTTIVFTPHDVIAAV